MTDQPIGWAEAVRLERERQRAAGHVIQIATYDNFTCSCGEFQSSIGDQLLAVLARWRIHAGL